MMNTSKNLLLFAWIFCLTVPVLEPNKSFGQDEEAEKKEAEKSAVDHIRKWAASLNDNTVDTMFKYYEESDELEVFTSSGTRFQGFKKTRKAFAEDFKVIRFSDSQVKNISARMLNGIAIVDFEHLFKIKFSQDNSSWQVHIRTSSVLRKVDGNWKIAHEHSSSIHGTERMVKLDD